MRGVGGADLVDVALSCAVHCRANAGGKQLLCRESKRLASKLQQVVRGLRRATDHNLEMGRGRNMKQRQVNVWKL